MSNLFDCFLPAPQDVTLRKCRGQIFFQRQQPALIRVELDAVQIDRSTTAILGKLAIECLDLRLQLGSLIATGCVRREMDSGNCSCDVKNPQGRCCLGDVRAAYGELKLADSVEG